MITTQHHRVQNVRDLTTSDLAALRPTRPPPSGTDYQKGYGMIDQLVDAAADKEANTSMDGLTWALSLRYAWQMVTDMITHQQWELIEALTQVETLKERIKLLEEEIAS